MLKNKIAVIGLGYVGLPLAMAFAEKYRVTGFDINPDRINKLNKGEDHTGEAATDRLVLLQDNLLHKGSVTGLWFTDEVKQLQDCTIFIITVPTPVDGNNKPDLTLFKQATHTVGQVLKKGDIVIYESTVYPGCTEETAVPILEQVSGLRFNTDFFAGYSPERINPGDKSRDITQIKKITSGSTAEIAERIDKLYASIILAGTYLAPSIKIAEAAKVIENAQRDNNIAFVNELSKIFHLLGIDTGEVLKAAGTKWNFLPFEPGLVGGHCIGIDPYYLADKAITVGYEPEIVLAARKMNDSMGQYVAARVVNLMKLKNIALPGTEILIMGITFKENFADVRNSRVVDIVHALSAYEVNITIYDPMALPESVSTTYGLQSVQTLPKGKQFTAIIVAVNHTEFQKIDYRALLTNPGVLFDVKGGITDTLVDGRL